jgi:hypothetical protein
MDAMMQRQQLLRAAVQEDALVELTKDYSNGHEESHLHMPFVIDELCYRV